MDESADSRDPLVHRDISDVPQGHDNEGSDLSDCHDSSDQLSMNPAPAPVETPPSHSPEPQVPHLSSSSQHSLVDNCLHNDISEKYDASQMDGDAGTVSSSTPAPTHLCHSRGASQVSSGQVSLCRTSGRELCHSRGASTDGSIMDAYTSSATESRRGTYSEAGTIPIGSFPEGSTIIEESLQGWDHNSEKKLSDGSLNHRTYSQKLASHCNCCKPFLRTQNELSEHPTRTELVKYAFTCPPHGKLGNCLMWIVAGFSFWGCLISITGSMALPGGNFFSLLVLYVAARLAGEAAAYAGLPSLLGSLVIGILFKSIPGVNVIGHNLDKYWSSALRSIALVIILIRAGLGLDPVALKKLSCIVLRLAFMPCVVEAITTGIASKFFLALPWSWSFMLGFIVAAVSPAVVVPCLLKLGEDGYGVDKGIPTLVIAAASLDDVLAITGFSVMFGLTFAEGSAVWTIVKGPIEIFAGIMYGIIMGLLCWFLPHQEKENRATYKLIVLSCLGGLAMFGSHQVKLESAGAIAVLSVAFVAGLGWRRPGHEDAEVGQNYRTLWEIFQPLLFSLIGTEIDVMAIDPSTVGWGLLALCIGLTLRVIISFVVVMGASFTIWERLFIAIAWLPKATVQAAIGSMALDYLRQHDDSPQEDIDRGIQVVTIAVMVILVTAPLGAAAIKLTGPKFLLRRVPGQPAQGDPETTV